MKSFEEWLSEENDDKYDDTPVESVEKFVWDEAIKEGIAEGRRLERERMMRFAAWYHHTMNYTSKCIDPITDAYEIWEKTVEPKTKENK